MKYVSIFLMLLPYLPEVCRNMEVLFVGEKTGAEKKAATLAAMEAILAGVLDVSTGGQAETWTKIKPLVSIAVDVVCKFLFKSA